MAPFQERITQRWSSTIFEKTQRNMKVLWSSDFDHRRFTTKMACHLAMCRLTSLSYHPTKLLQGDTTDLCVVVTCRHLSWPVRLYNWCWTGLASLREKIATVKAKQKHEWPWAPRAVAPLPPLVAASFSSSWEEGSSPLNGDMVISSICPTNRVIFEKNKHINTISIPYI